MEKTTLMTEGDYRRQILSFALPLFLGSLFQQLYSTVDSLIVGNYLGSSALAAVTSTGTLSYMVVGFFLGFSSGASVIIARQIGAQQDEEVHKAVHTAVSLGLIFGVIMTVVGVCGTDTMLKWTATPADVFADASVYLRTYFMGSMGLIMYNILVGILQASGDSRHPLYYLIFSSIVNMILDILFIAVFHMGIKGAGLATAAAQFCSMLLVLNRLIRTGESYRVNIRHLLIDMHYVRAIFSYGLPTALQGCVIDFANLLIQAYINSFGKAAMAGLGAYSRIEGFMFLPITSFSLALTTYVSQNLGARKEKRAFQGIRFGTLCTLISIELIGMVIYLFAPQLIHIFIQEEEVIAYGVLRARICAPFYFLIGFSHVTSAVMRGLGKPVVPMAVMLICWCGVRVAAVYLLGETLHSIAFVSWLYPFTWGLSTLVYIAEYVYVLKKEYPGVNMFKAA